MVHSASQFLRRIAVTCDREGRYPNRSRALQSAVDILAERDKQSPLAGELKKLDRGEEQRLAEEGIGDWAWPRS